MVQSGLKWYRDILLIQYFGFSAEMVLNYPFGSTFLIFCRSGIETPFWFGLAFSGVETPFWFKYFVCGGRLLRSSYIGSVCHIGCINLVGIMI